MSRAHDGQVGVLRQDGVAKIRQPADANFDARATVCAASLQHLLDFLGPRRAVVVAGVQQRQPGAIRPVCRRHQAGAVIRRNTSSARASRPGLPTRTAAAPAASRSCALQPMCMKSTPACSSRVGSIRECAPARRSSWRRAARSSPSVARKPGGVAQAADQVFRLPATRCAW